ncbi:N-acetylglucosamine-6-phosphate deacetylase [Listeria booriae]|uniref:N-acetylglucosamine-6-phosphate deacetylase n=1 Tax=Listeria booriae TaxID=1552123 RepID=UPI0016239AFA|nr:N-acetylglucosamine-6-phosphate deacetylase [Listeria booriae]MBC1523649.1 N-acetylglucosamine-6-phosphate deacetylase [Listeria booriae]MBC1531192.1 N-acetylglucosamine-6-phosphate deacetylase [Listeria booriae]MBC6133694.1 N-acetylglucosamine-6-phosphate deacetylase [Listeria booriae]
MTTLMKNIQISGEKGTKAAHIIIHDGKIQKITDTIGDESAYDTIIEGQNQFLIPGMIDVHIHGANHYDMMDGTTKSIQEVSKKCLETGCTGFLVTSVTSSLEQLLAMIEATKQVVGNEMGAKILGIHLEGPYLNIEKKGMQNPAFLRHPDLDEMKEIMKHADGLIKMVTIAPELPGAKEMIAYLKSQDIVVAAGHTNATYEEAIDAFDRGVTHITHCCNAMPQIHHRSPGITTAALERDGVSVQAIVDNVHLHPGIVRLMHKVKTADQMVLITDALQAMGVGDGDYKFGGHHVTVTDGVARLDDGTLASSTVTMNQALKVSTDMAIPLHDTIKMATTTPAQILNENNIGRIEIGKDSDLVLLNENFEVISVLLKGEIAI